MTPRQPRRPRSVKVEDELWEAAKAKAEERGDVLSEEIRKFLQRYVRSKQVSEHILNEFQTTQCPVECVRANVDLEDGVLVCSACGAEVDERRS